MEAASAVAMLHHTADVERAGERALQRLADVHAFLGSEMAWVEAELRAQVRKGVSPGTEAAVHLLEAGGKRVRPLALLLASACFGAIPPQARDLAVSAELVHLATLLHDDVIDDGQERRGLPTSRRIWGNAVSVLAGDLLLTHALERTCSVGNQTILSELVQTLRALVDGEIVQLRGRTQLDLSEETYFRIVRDKTASLFRWAARAGGCICGAPSRSIDALGDFGMHLGIAFQLVDDVLDYAGDESVTGKALFADLNEGKLTLPLLRAASQSPCLARDLQAVRSQADESNACVSRLVEAVKSSGACNEVRDLARSHTRSALESLDRVPHGPARDCLSGVALDLTRRIA